MYLTTMLTRPALPRLTMPIEAFSYGDPMSSYRFRFVDEMMTRVNVTTPTGSRLVHASKEGEDTALDHSPHAYDRV